GDAQYHWQAHIGDEYTSHHTAEDHARSHGQIDPAGNNDERDAEGEETDCGDGREDRRDVRQCEERIWVNKREDDDDDDEAGHSEQLLQRIPPEAALHIMP